MKKFLLLATPEILNVQVMVKPHWPLARWRKKHMNVWWISQQSQQIQEIYQLEFKYFEIQLFFVSEMYGCYAFVKTLIGLRVLPQYLPKSEFIF